MSTRRKLTMDGNTAAAYVSYALIDAAIIFSIIPSSPMAESIDEWAVAGRKNIFGRTVVLREMKSKGGAAGTLAWLPIGRGTDSHLHSVPGATVDGSQYV